MKSFFSNIANGMQTGKIYNQILKPRWDALKHAEQEKKHEFLRIVEQHANDEEIAEAYEKFIGLKRNECIDSIFVKAAIDVDQNDLPDYANILSRGAVHEMIVQFAPRVASNYVSLFVNRCSSDQRAKVLKAFDSTIIFSNLLTHPQFTGENAATELLKLVEGMEDERAVTLLQNSRSFQAAKAAHHDLAAIFGEIRPALLPAFS